MLYNLIRGFLYPFILIYLIFSPKKFKFFISRFFQDITFLKQDKSYIWIHCSSVGEVNLTDSLIKEINKKFNNYILITTFTDTGFNTAQTKYMNNPDIFILKFPFDDYFIIKKILNYIKIKYLVLIETEIWPNLINLNYKNSKIFMVNGRISNRSFPRYKKLIFILKPLFSKIQYFCMQTEDDKNKIISLGADPKKVFTTGNLKFDISFEIYSESEKETLKSKINNNNRKIFVAGSTREGEDSIIINVFKKLTSTLLVIVPRHLERVEDIEKLLLDSNLSFKKYSDIQKDFNNENYDVIIVDKMGLLRMFYAIADITFVGGTLVNIGGHSLLEPLFYGNTPIFGPYLQNVKDISNDILTLNLGYKVTNEDEFLNAINLLETNKVSEDKIKEFFRYNQNTTEKIIKLMEE